MLQRLAVPAVNRLLRSNGWALERLRPHAYKTALVNCPPASLSITVLESGELEAAEAGALPDVTINLSPGLLLRLAARDASAWAQADVSGDVQFAAALDYISRNVRWDYEEGLSRVFGDIAAHRLANGVRAADRWGRDAALSLGRAIAEYATYERPIVASATALEGFVREVDELREDVARLEKRVELLMREGRKEPGEP